MESVLAEEVLNAAPSKAQPGKSHKSTTEAAIEHFIYETHGSLGARHRSYSYDLALTYSAVYRCIAILSQTLASTGWHVYESQANGKGKRQIDLDERTEAGTVAWILGKSPDDELTSVAWRETAYAEAIAKGNSYSFIKREDFGKVSAAWRIAPERVIPFRSDGSLYYYVKREDDRTKGDVVSPRDILHLKGPSPDGMVGYSVIGLARRTIELGMRQEDFGSTFFERGPMPGGVLTIPQNIKEEDRKQLRADFERVYGGTSNAGRVVVLSGNQTFTKLDLNNTDAQFLESRRFSVEDVCRWFGVPPHKVYDLTRATFSNIEHQSIEFVQDSVLPWAVRFEAEADMKFFGRVNRGRHWTKHNLQAFLRGDSTAQTANLATQVNSGMRTPNEAREQIDLNPIKGGDTPLIQGAMIPLERALEEPNPPAPNPMPTQTTNDDEDDDAPPSNVAAPLRLLFAEKCSQLLRVESDKAKRAANRGGLNEWRRNFYGDPSSAAAQYLPATQAALDAMGVQADACKLANVIGEAHNRYGNESDDILNDLADKERPQRFAEECINLAWRSRK